MAIELTLKQRAFASQYVRHNGNATKAALAAGYSPSGAHVEASRLLRKPKIKRQIDKLTRKYDITPERVLTRLDNLSLKAQEAGNYPAAVRAEELIGKSLGMWVDRSVSVNLDLTGQHIDAIRALASRRRNKSGGAAGDDAQVIEGEATIGARPADKSICHNVGYTTSPDKSVIDQQVTPDAPLKQSGKTPSDVDGDNI